MVEYELFGKRLQNASVAHKLIHIPNLSIRYAIYFSLTKVSDLLPSWSHKCAL